MSDFEPDYVYMIPLKYRVKEVVNFVIIYVDFL